MQTLHRVDELNTLTRAKYPIIYIVSWEERRIEDILRQVAIDRRKKLYGWTLTNGIAPLDVIHEAVVGRRIETPGDVDRQRLTVPACPAGEIWTDRAATLEIAFEVEPDPDIRADAVVVEVP